MRICLFINKLYVYSTITNKLAIKCEKELEKRLDT